MTVEEIKVCRFCGEEKLETVLELPLELVRCENCTLAQLRHTVDQDSLYKHGWSRSSVTERAGETLKELAETAQYIANVQSGDTVLDIGTSNGVLLGWYPGVVKTVGVDPCKESIEDGLQQRRMDIGLIGYFSEELVRTHGPFKAITAVGMFQEVPDPVRFLTECQNVMTKDGVLIIQLNYLVEILKNFRSESICPENLTYPSLIAMKEATKRAGLEIVGAEVQGGDIKIYMTHKEIGLSELPTQRQLDLFMMMMKLTYEEMKLELDTKLPYDKFRIGVEERRTDDMLRTGKESVA